MLILYSIINNNNKMKSTYEITAEFLKEENKKRIFLSSKSE